MSGAFKVSECGRCQGTGTVRPCTLTSHEDLVTCEECDGEGVLYEYIPEEQEEVPFGEGLSESSALGYAPKDWDPRYQDLSPE